MSDTLAKGGAPPEVTPAQLQEAAERFSMARSLILSLWPYLHAAAFRLVPRWTAACPTMGVDDKWRIYMNPLFVLKQSPIQLALLVTCHELRHVLYGHAYRLVDYRDAEIEINGETHSLTNIAFDLAINSGFEADIASAKAWRQSRKSGDRQLIDVNALVLPPEAVYPEKFLDNNGKPFPSGLLAEEYLELLLKSAKNKKTKNGKGKSGNDKKSGSAKGDNGHDHHACAGECGSGGGQRRQPWEDDSPAEGRNPDSGVTEGEQEVLRRQVAKAAQEQAQRHPGTVPGHAERWAEVVLKPPAVNWLRELAAVVRDGVNWLRGQHNRSYVRRNRRQVVRPVVAGEVLLPGRVKPTPDLILVLDTSGSMQDSDFADAFSEMRAVLAIAGGLVPVIPCDAAASEVQWVRRVEDVRMVGGGGTDMRVGIANAYEVTKARLILVLTDSYTPWPDNPPAEGVRVIACLTQRGGTPPPAWMRTVYTKPEG